MYKVERKKLEYLVHITGNEIKVTEMYSGIKKSRVREALGKRISWIQNLRKGFATSNSELSKAARNKIIIARKVANIRKRIRTKRKRSVN